MATPNASNMATLNASLDSGALQTAGAVSVTAAVSALLAILIFIFQMLINCLLPYFRSGGGMRVVRRKPTAVSRPGNLLEAGLGRWLYVLVIAVAIYDLQETIMGDNNGIKVLKQSGLHPLLIYTAKLFMCLFCGILFYPLAVAAYSMTLIGYIYGVVYCTVQIVKYILDDSRLLWNRTPNVLVLVLETLPKYLLFIMVLGEFLRSLYIFRKREKTDKFQASWKYKLDFAEKYVKKLINEEGRPKAGWKASMKSAATSYVYYRYSTNIMVAIGCSVIVVLTLAVRAAGTFVENFGKISDLVLALITKFGGAALVTPAFLTSFNLWHWALTLSALSSIALAALLCAVHGVLTLHNYHRCMIEIYRGRLHRLTSDVSDAPAAIMGNGLQYVGYQIGYAIWGFSIHTALFFVIILVVCAVALIIFHHHNFTLLFRLINLLLPIVIWSLLVKVVHTVLVRFCFLSKDEVTGERRLIINNKRAFANFHYFLVFLSTPLGLFSCLKRILMTTLLGIVNISRLDRSPFDRFNENWDSGFRSFISVLRLENMFSNPTMLVFANILLESRRNNDELRPVRPIGKKNYKVKWLVCWTLINNPSIIPLKKKWGLEHIGAETANNGIVENHRNNAVEDANRQFEIPIEYDNKFVAKLELQ